jgi:hypothetical protein
MHNRYLELLQRFLDGDITANTFHNGFLEEFRRERDQVEPKATVFSRDYEVLEPLFGAVDAYCPDPALRDGFEESEEALRGAAALALFRYQRQPLGGSPGTSVSQDKIRKQA